MHASEPPRSPEPGIRSDRFYPAFRQWLVGEHDYAWVVDHHSMRPLHVPIRAVFASNTLLLAVCSLLMLNSDQGPTTTAGDIWVFVMVGLQLACIAFLIYSPVPGTQRLARMYFVGFAVFGDLGLTSVLLLYAPMSAAFGCTLFALNSALCTYFVSSRWLLAHMAWSASIIAYTAWRVQEAQALDLSAAIVGGTVLAAAVCAVPVSAHMAWTLLSIDARQSLLDPLTGVRNRRGIEASMEPLWRDTVMAGTAIAAVVIDIDNFKRINDTYGHEVGDDVLKQLSERMVMMAGSSAVVGRTGGEEFTLIAIGPADEMVSHASRLPEHLRTATGAAPVTVSVGLAVIEKPAGDYHPAAMTAAVRAADERMYRAKRSGGDRICIAVL